MKGTPTYTYLSISFGKFLHLIFINYHCLVLFLGQQSINHRIIINTLHKNWWWMRVLLLLWPIPFLILRYLNSWTRPDNGLVTNCQGVRPPPSWQDSKLVGSAFLFGFGLGNMGFGLCLHFYCVLGFGNTYLYNSHNRMSENDFSDSQTGTAGIG